MNVIGVVPARGGSKGVRRKNARLMHGRPLLAYTADAALGARTLARVVLTTDDAEIAAIGRECGLDVPFLRPPELAEDGTPMLPVIEHAVRFLETAGETIDAIVLLQPTSPMRTAEDIDACVNKLIEERADTVISVLRVPHQYNPHWVYMGDPRDGLRLSTGELQPISRRQLLPSAWHREGSVYVTRRHVLYGGSIYGEKLLGHEIDAARSVNIDDERDWLLAERLLGERAP